MSSMDFEGALILLPVCPLNELSLSKGVSISVVFVTASLFLVIFAYCVYFILSTSLRAVT